MDGGKARTLEIHISKRSLILVIAVLAALIVPVAWSIRQSYSMRNELNRAIAAEQAKADAEQSRNQAQGKLKVLRDEAIQRAARRDPKVEDERARQLAEEIENLTRGSMIGSRRISIGSRPRRRSRSNPRPWTHFAIREIEIEPSRPSRMPARSDAHRTGSCRRNSGWVAQLQPTSRPRFSLASQSASGAK